MLLPLCCPCHPAVHSLLEPPVPLLSCLASHAVASPNACRSTQARYYTILYFQLTAPLGRPRASPAWPAQFHSCQLLTSPSNVPVRFSRGGRHHPQFHQITPARSTQTQLCVVCLPGGQLRTQTRFQHLLTLPAWLGTPLPAAGEGRDGAGGWLSIAGGGPRRGRLGRIAQAEAG